MADTPKVEAADEEILYQFDKNEREVVKLRKSVFKDKHYIDLRLYVKGMEGQEDIPTKKGVNIPAELVDELKKALAKL